MKIKTVGLSLLIITLLNVAATVDAQSHRFEKKQNQAAFQARDNQGNRENRDRDRAKPRESARDTGDRQDRRQDRREYDRRDDRRDDRYDDRRDDRWERYVKYRIGLRLLTLPVRHHQVVVGSTVYYYSDGVYFMKRGTAYTVVGAPIGIRVGNLPYGFRNFHVGHRRYFYANHTYYVYAPATYNYVVVAAPSGAPTTFEDLSPVVYPASGQSDEQMEQDRYECHRWAMDDSAFDPTGTQANSSAEGERYYRALSVCLSGRGYTVN